MKIILGLALTAFILSGLAVSVLACGQDSDSTAVTEEQVVAVQRGDLTVDITAVGNLAFSHQEELTFEVAGTVGEVLVEVGDSVEEGQVLAELDASEWEEQIDALERNLTAAEDNLTSAERNLTSAERNLTTAERNLTSAERNVTSAERNLIQAEMNLVNAEIALEEAQDVYEWPDIRTAQLKVNDAESLLAYAQWNLDKATSPSDIEAWTNIVEGAEATLSIAEDRLEAIFSAYDMKQVEVKKLAVELAQGRVEDAEQDIVDAQPLVVDAEQDIVDAQQDIVDAQQAIVDAQQTVEDAQQELDEVNTASLVISAPFAGLITAVNVDGGGEVKEGTVAVAIADPTKFETDILVSEMDIFNIRLGAEAIIQVDSLSGISLPASVTFISPMATIQQGVVNYEVKVEIESLEAVMQERQEAMQEAMPDISSGELPDRIKQAIEEGFITQEQAEEMLEQMQEGKMPFQQGGEQGDITIPQEGGQWPTITSADLQLREGLTVTISIIVEERSGVLLVPNSAITASGRQTYVQVLSPDGTIEERAITTGISDWQYTEVIEGLIEGEQVVVPQGTTTTPATQQDRPGGIMPFPGMGRQR